MGRRAWAWVAALAVAGPALAEEGKVCGRVEVLDLVASRLSGPGRGVEVERGAAGQAPGVAGEVLCAVWVRVSAYDTARSPAPLQRWAVQRFSLQAGRNGWFLTLLP